MVSFIRSRAIEKIVVILAIIVQLAGIFIHELRDANLILSWGLLIWFIFSKLPNFLDKLFSVQVFQRKDIKIPLILFSFLLFYFFISTTYEGINKTIPKFLIQNNPHIIELGISILYQILILFISFFYFSWRLTGHKLPIITSDFKSAHPAYKIYTLIIPSYDRKNNIEILKFKKFDKYFFLYLGCGLPIGGICFVVMGLYNIIVLGDLAFLFFILTWLIWDQLSKRKFKEQSIFKKIDLFEKKFYYESSIRLGIVGVGGVASIILFIIYMFAISIMLNILSYDIISFLIFNYVYIFWYPTMILIQIARRLSILSLYLKQMDRKIPILPQYNNIIIILISLHQFYSAIYFKLNIPINKLIILPTILNLLCIISLLLYKKRKTYTLNGKYVYINDRLKIGLLTLCPTIFYFIIVKSSIKMLIFIISTIGSLIFLSFYEIIEIKIKKFRKLQQIIIINLYLSIISIIILFSMLFAFPNLINLIITIFIIIAFLIIINVYSRARK